MSYENAHHPEGAPVDGAKLRAALIRRGALTPADEVTDDRGEALADRRRVLTLDPARRREE